MKTYKPEKHTLLWFVGGQKNADYTEGKQTVLQLYTHIHTVHPGVVLGTGPVSGCRITWAEDDLASTLVMDSVKLARAPYSGAICQPTRCQQRQRYKYLTLGELCLYAPSKMGEGVRQLIEESGVSVIISCILICVSTSFSSLFLLLCALQASACENNNST